MSKSNWRNHAGTTFNCQKRPACGNGGMVVANHPLGAAAGAQMLAAGGNAVDAAVATLFALSVVEPMMVGIFGGGMAHVRFPDGRHLVLDGQATAPGNIRPDQFTPLSDDPATRLEVAGRENAVGIKAPAVPGTLKGWCDLLQRYGRLELAEVMAPAIQHACLGFQATAYLSECIGEAAADLAKDPALSALYLRDGAAIPAGTRIVQSDYGETLKMIAAEGPAVLYGGALGQRIVDHMTAAGGLIDLDDLKNYRTIERDPVRGRYRDFEVIGPPPPSSGGVHVLQMLNILEGYDIAGLGFGTADNLHLLAEVLKIAFADRAASTADPAFVDVPVARLIDKTYADERRAALDMARAQQWSNAVAAAESANTTHVTCADRDGMVVATTQTINSLFGARIILPGTGIIANNYMSLFDPHPGRVLSIEPGKRIPTSMAPVMALEDGKLRFALGLPGGLRIFGTAMQALVNLIDHGMRIQEAVEAPRLWTQGQAVEVEEAYPSSLREELTARGHALSVLQHVGGGMNAIEFDDEGGMTGAACWRADGTPVALAGGPAAEGARFWPDQPGKSKPS